MPTYEYACDACGASFELEQRITEAPIKTCPNCGKDAARRMISGGTFMLKGSGWYADGYSGKSNGVGKDSGAKSESSGESKPAESKPAESKPKTESKAAAAD